ncbi:hypothetical protein [Streptomyces atratus]|uniref:hypothetical protein n=1 Tax=Streptomyces atratus TaxID=1893 RepID=UPI0021A2E270|nr:hypothetical protein [Streptomyces atratus]MCT2548098.1 hypothetical protein [Streptomyces atratus]
MHTEMLALTSKVTAPALTRRRHTCDLIIAKRRADGTDPETLAPDRWDPKPPGHSATVAGGNEHTETATGG